MRIKDFTDTIRHLTDPFNIPEARRMIAENPALTQEQFIENSKELQPVAEIISQEFDLLSPREEQYYQQPPFSTHQDFLAAEGGRIGFYKGELVKIKPGLFKRKDSKTYRVIQQRGGGERIDVSKKTRKEAEKVLADYIKKNPPAKQVVPEGSKKFLKAYLKERNLTNWTDLTTLQKSNFIRLWPKYQKQQVLTEGMIPESKMAERLGISKANLANLRKKNSIFHKKLVDLTGKPVNLVGAAGGTLGERGEYIYYKPIDAKNIKLAQKYLPQQFGFITEDVTQRIKTLAGDDWFMDQLKKVTTVDDVAEHLPLKELMARFPKLKLTDSKLSNAVVRLGQIMQGHVEYRGLEDIGLNKVLGNRISRIAEAAPFGNVFKAEAYKIAMANIDRQFGDEVGTFANYRDRIKTEFRRLGFKDFNKFNLDEYVGVSIGGWKKSGQFSVFSRLLEKNVNQKSGASYLARLSKATDALEAAIAKDTTQGWKEAEKIVKANKADALRTIKKTKNTMPYLSLSAPGSPTNFGVKRLNQLEAQKLGIKDFFKERKYTYSGLGEAYTQKEVLAALEQGETGSLKNLKIKTPNRIINSLIESGIGTNCKRGVVPKAQGGRIGMATADAGLVSCVTRHLNQTMNQAKKASTMGQAAKARLLKAGKALMRWGVPIDVAIEGTLAYNNYLKGDTPQEAFEQTLFGLLTPKTNYESLTRDRLKEIGGKELGRYFADKDKLKKLNWAFESIAAEEADPLGTPEKIEEAKKAYETKARGLDWRTVESTMPTSPYYPRKSETLTTPEGRTITSLGPYEQYPMEALRTKPGSPYVEAEQRAEEVLQMDKFKDQMKRNYGENWRDKVGETMTYGRYKTVRPKIDIPGVRRKAGIYDERIDLADKYQSYRDWYNQPGQDVYRFTDKDIEKMSDKDLRDVLAEWGGASKYNTGGRVSSFDGGIASLLKK